MSISGQSGRGKIVLFDDFMGVTVPVADTNSSAKPGAAIGPFKITGQIDHADSGVITLTKENGYVTLYASDDEDANGCAIGTEVALSPLLNGTLVLETRVEMAALTTRNVFIGFCAANAVEILEPLTSTGTTLTAVVACVGFHFDSTLTADATAATAVWHMPYLLALSATQTSTDVAASQVAVVDESDVLRVEVDNNGAARWYINGKLEQSAGAALAATPATKLAGVLAIFGKSSIPTISADYLLITANRDWTR